MKHEAYLRENFSAKELKLLSSLAVGLKKEVDQIDYGIFTEDEKNIYEIYKTHHLQAEVSVIIPS